MMEILASPTFVGLLQAAGIGVLVMLAALGQWLGKRKENAAVAPSKDIMIPSVTVADRQALEHMAETLRDAEHAMRGHRDHDMAMLYELKAIKDSNARMESLLGRMLDRLPK